jgi:hypothetical protein
MTTLALLKNSTPDRLVIWRDGAGTGAAASGASS